jgi:hypothetical protein
MPDNPEDIKTLSSSYRIVKPRVTLDLFINHGNPKKGGYPYQVNESLCDAYNDFL